MNSFRKFSFYLILLTIISLNYFHANAQLSKGTWTIGGTISGDFNSNDDIKNGSYNTEYGIQITPMIGYFVSEHVEIFSGIGVGITNSHSTDVNSSSNLLTYYISLSPGFDYYFLKSDSKFNFFIQSSISFQYGHYKSENSIGGVYNDEETTFNFIASVSPGVIYFFNSKIGIYSSIGLIKYDFSDRENKQFGNSLTVNLNLASLNFGLKYIIGGK